MGSVLFVVFSYNREQMLESLLVELDGFNVVVVDDGSEWSKVSNAPYEWYYKHDIIRTIHEGKQGFWKKWLLARQIALGTNHDYFVFLPDDASQIDLEAIQEITKQGWTDRPFTLNLLNCGERYRWGKWQAIQEDFKLAERTWKQCDYVDGAFITNRATLTAIEIDPVPSAWFDRPDKSSGVGYQMTQKLRAINCPMMLPDKSLAYHGDHESVMHPEHRKDVKLISKMESDIKGAPLSKEIVAVIACYGRLPLLKYTIERLIKKNRCAHVVCVGGQEEKETILEAGGIFVEHENKPLGKKWNAGFMRARELKPDGVLFVGSSDWLSDNWLDVLTPHLDQFDMIGKADFYMLDIGTTLRSCLWHGYGRGERESEPIGIGRLVSARIMDAFDWQPFDDNRNNSMDWQMYLKVNAAGGKLKLLKGDHIRSLSISTNRWNNMHRFEDHWNNKVPSKSDRINPIWVDTYFPEHKLIFE